MRPAQLSGCMKIPLAAINYAQVRKKLTYSYTPMGERESVKVQGYRREGDFLCVPRQFGLALCNQLQLEVEDYTSQGSAVEFPSVPRCLPYQEAPLHEIATAFDDYYDVLFRAHTGWGKTVGALITAASLGRSVIVIVDQDNLKEQWIKVLRDPKLFGLRADQVGLVQGDVCQYEGRLVTIAMVQTLTQREYPDEFYESFGTLIGDEVHTLGAPTFSQVLFMFPAAYRLFVSATPKRRDGLQRALDHHCGPLRVAADKKHDASAVYILRNHTVYSWYANISPKTGRIIAEVTEDPGRNMLIAEAAVWLYESGRATLILSDRVEHLKSLQSMLVYMGVPEEEIGMYTGYDIFWQFTKDPTPKSLPRGLHTWMGDDGKKQFAPYSAVSMQAKQKKVPKARLAAIEKDCSFILATFGKFAKGMDVPRLAGGIDASPRSQAEQAQGRILRRDKGKLKPIWVTVVDDNSYRLLYSFSGRIGEYLNSNSRLYEWDGQEGAVEWNERQLRAEVSDRHQRLKAMEIRSDPHTGQHQLVKAGTRQRQAGAEMKEKFARLRRRAET